MALAKVIALRSYTWLLHVLSLYSFFATCIMSECNRYAGVTKSLIISSLFNQLTLNCLICHSQIKRLRSFLYFSLFKKILKKPKLRVVKLQRSVKFAM
jgi:hypothetical protein